MPRIFNTTPSAKIRNDYPGARVSSFQTGRAGEVSTIPVGTPIGLLLALTYAAVVSIGNYGEFRPNVRIQST